jgi:hypothetical protein
MIDGKTLQNSDRDEVCGKSAEDSSVLTGLSFMKFDRLAGFAAVDGNKNAGRPERAAGFTLL